MCTCGQYSLAVTCSLHNSALDESKVILTVEKRNKRENKKQKSTSKKKKNKRNVQMPSNVYV